MQKVEEEVIISEILDQLRRFNCQGNGLYMMDKDFKSRTFVDTTQE